MRALWVVATGAAVALGGGCGAEDREASAPADLEPPTRATLIEGGVLSCADPGRRSSQHFDLRSAEGKRLPEANLAGGGMVVEDFDQDGALDLFLPSETYVQLWFGDGAGGFEDRATTALAGIDLSMGVGGAAADVDADGDLDLLVTRWERPNRLLRNEGGRVFVDVTEVSGLGHTTAKHQSASWGDMDADGDLDLFVGTYGEVAKILDESCDDHLADRSALYRNRGDGTFEDVSDLLPEAVHNGYVFASGWYDIDEDGFPELLSSHDDGVCEASVLVDNIDGTSFVVDVGSGISRDAHDMGIGVGDLNGDEIPDFLLTSFQRSDYLQSLPSDRGANGVIWADATGARGLVVDPEAPYAQAYGWGAEFGDVDNDGDLDAVMTFGYWSYYPGPLDPRYQRDGLWIQDGAGQFSNEAQSWGVADKYVGRGVVLADVNDDGWLDLLKRQLDEPTLMYLSRCGTESWVRVRLRDDAPNTYGVGAKIRVIADGTTRVRWITSGSTGMYTGAPLEAHFGLGSADRIERLEVVWPDMRVDAFEDLAARQVLTVTRAP